MKYNICWLALSLFIANAATVAQPQIGAQRTIGGNGGDYLYAMATTHDGGYIVGGVSNSGISGDKTESSKGFDDFWLVKLNKKGQIQWDKTIGGSDFEYLYSIEQTADGGYILGGFSYSNQSGDKTENSRGFSDYWIVKLDSAGNIQWDKTVGGARYDYLNIIQQTPDGGYIAGGYSNSPGSGEKSQNSKGGYDYWVVKLDNAGVIEWDKTIGGSKEEDLYSIAQTNDGGFVLGGVSYSGISGDRTQESRGISDYWVVKLDNVGNMQWDKRYGGALNDVLVIITQTSDNGYLMGGSSLSDISGDKKQNSKGGNDYWIIKTDSTGKIQWSQTYGGNDTDEFGSLQETMDGGFIIGGSSYSDVSGDKTEPVRETANDHWIIKLNRRGEIQWDKTIGGSAWEYLVDIKESGKNNYVAAGYSTSDAGYDKTTDSKGDNDFWLVQLKYSKPDSAPAVATLPNNTQAATGKSNAGFSVYPNPAKDILHIQNAGKATITLTDQSGKTILTKTINGNGVINVSHLPAGFYYLKNNETKETEKILISK